MDRQPTKLARKTVLGFTQLIAALGILLFAPAWTFDYWQAWVYLLVFAASSALITIYLWKKDRKLLERRTNAVLEPRLNVHPDALNHRVASSR